jgi:hypothetical protein
MKVVTIQLKRETRERLKDAGTKRETYDDIIVRLLDFWETNRGSTYFEVGGYTSYNSKTEEP